MFRLKCIGQLGLALALLLACGPGRAAADSFTYYLSTPNSALSGNPQGTIFGTVTVNLISSTQANITFSALTNGGTSFLFTDGSSAALNVNATTFGVSNVKGSNSYTNTAVGYTVNNVANQQVDGMGKFNLTLDSGSSTWADTATSISFTLTDTSGTWASALSVLVANGSGHFAASHMGQTTDVNSQSFSQTGYVGDGPGPVTPEPGSFALLGIGVAGLAGYAWRRRKPVSA
jgi:hypothetical protein